MLGAKEFVKNKKKEKHKKLEQYEAGGFPAVSGVSPSSHPLNDGRVGLGETGNGLASGGSCQNLGSF